jgi:CHAT domain-containing protein/Tfp pilus assembly protein PilF
VLASASNPSDYAAGYTKALELYRKGERERAAETWAELDRGKRGTQGIFHGGRDGEIGKCSKPCLGVLPTATFVFGIVINEKLQAIAVCGPMNCHHRHMHRGWSCDHLRAVASLLLALSLSIAGLCVQAAERDATLDGAPALTKSNLLWRIRDLEIREKSLGPEHPDVATSLSNLAGLYRDQGHYPEAEPLFKRALAIREKVFGPEHPDVATSLNDLAWLYDLQGRYAEAEPLFKRSLSIREKALGDENAAVAQSLNYLGLLYTHQGRYADAEPLLTRALSIGKKVFGPEHVSVAWSQNNLAVLYFWQGRDAEAESLHKRSLAIQERVYLSDDPRVALSLSNLGWIYLTQGRYAEAEPLLTRALAIREKVFGPEHPDVASSQNNLAALYLWQGRYAEAERLYQRSLATEEKMLGSEHRAVGMSLQNLATLYFLEGRYADAEPLLTRALAIREKVFGTEHPLIAGALNNLAGLYRAQDRYAEAEPLYKRAVAIREETLGPDDPELAGILTGWADLRNDQGALALARRATAIRRKRISLKTDVTSIGSLSEQRTYATGYAVHIRLLASLLAADPAQREALTAESFDVAQLARASDTAETVALMAARFAKGSDELAALVRARQDTVARWRFVDGELVKAVSKPPVERNAGDERALRDELAKQEKKLAELGTAMEKRFPEYQNLIGPDPIPLTAAQALLRVNEALVTYLLGEKESYVWVLRRDQAQFLRLPIAKAEISESVRLLRSELDPSAEVLQRFDLAAAHALYRRIFAPAEPLLGGVTNVIVVPDGALQSLPFGVLVTAPPTEAADEASGYRDAAWLIKRYALTTIPSEGSLRALRRFARGNAGDRPFTGFGDPLLEGERRTQRVSVAALLSRGAVADVQAVRQLTRLPETADELLAMASSLGADKQSVHLRQDATVSNVKRMDLTHYRVLAFATHALMAGDFKGLAEPSLVLTPPEVGTEFDDGLLSASAVAQLKLNADWVILSACNTAAPDGTPGAEGLSGLAKAFFYAGSRSLLVAHWPVDSDATVKLTTRMIKESAASPGMGKAEALRRSMLALMADVKYAHPAFWAPFVVVGEGGPEPLDNSGADAHQAGGRDPRE